MSLAFCVNAQLFAFCWKFGETLSQRKELKNFAIITISSFYIRSEKEALKKRKKRTPTVAMTTEQYKAKRGILNSTPKKTGKCWKNIFLQMVVCILLSHSKMHVRVLIFTFQGTDCMRSQWKSFLSISKEHFRPSLQLLCKRNPGTIDIMISRNGILVKNLEIEQLNTLLLSDDIFADGEKSSGRKRGNKVSILVEDFDIEKHLERNRRITSNKAKTIQ